MEVKYNINCSIKNCENKTLEDIKQKFNDKLLNVILILESINIQEV